MIQNISVISTRISLYPIAQDLLFLIFKEQKEDHLQKMFSAKVKSGQTIPNAGQAMKVSSLPKCSSTKSILLKQTYNLHCLYNIATFFFQK